jgi:hypothetical protein
VIFVATVLPCCRPLRNLQRTADADNSFDCTVTAEWGGCDNARSNRSEGCSSNFNRLVLQVPWRGWLFLGCRPPADRRSKDQEQKRLANDNRQILLFELAEEDTVGLSKIRAVNMAPDCKSCAYTYEPFCRNLSRGRREITISCRTCLMRTSTKNSSFIHTDSLFHPECL